MAWSMAWTLYDACCRPRALKVEAGVRRGVDWAERSPVAWALSCPPIIPRPGSSSVLLCRLVTQERGDGASRNLICASLHALLCAWYLNTYPKILTAAVTWPPLAEPEYRRCHGGPARCP